MRLCGSSQALSPPAPPCLSSRPGGVLLTTAAHASEALPPLCPGPHVCVPVYDLVWASLRQHGGHWSDCRRTCKTSEPGLAQAGECPWTLLYSRTSLLYCNLSANQRSAESRPLRSSLPQPQVREGAEPGSSPNTAKLHLNSTRWPPPADASHVPVAAVTVRPTGQEHRRMGRLASDPTLLRSPIPTGRTVTSHRGGLMPMGSDHGAQTVSSLVPSGRHQGRRCTRPSAGKLGSWMHSQCRGSAACPAGVPVVAAHLAAGLGGGSFLCGWGLTAFPPGRHSSASCLLHDGSSTGC